MKTDDLKLVNGEWAHVHSERESRIQWENMARTLGCLPEFHQIINKFEPIVKRCTNQNERQAMTEMCVLEIHKLFDGHNSVGYGGKIIVGNKVVASQEFKKDENDGK
jgi:hypothetical protein